MWELRSVVTERGGAVRGEGGEAPATEAAAKGMDNVEAEDTAMDSGDVEGEDGCEGEWDGEPVGVVPTEEVRARVFGWGGSMCGLYVCLWRLTSSKVLL